MHQSIHVPFFHNRSGFFFDPPLGNGQGEGGSSPTPAPVPADPFANVDLNLLDDTAREAVTQARTNLQRLQSEAQTASQHQSRADQLQSQIQQYEQQIQSLQARPNGTAPDGPKTQEQKLTEYYTSQGLPAADAARVAKLNAGAFAIAAQDIQQNVGTAMAPVLGRVVQNTAQEAFMQVQQSDTLGMFSIPEVAQSVYDQATQMANQGQMVDPRVVAGLAKIKYIDHCVANNLQPLQNAQQSTSTFQPSNPLHQVPMLNQQNPPPQNTRFTYPGAGNLVQSRGLSQQSGSPMDSDTAAAVAATLGSWDPKLQQALKTKGGMR